MKLLHVSSYGDINPCGIADYTQDLINSLNDKDLIQETFVLPISTLSHDKKSFKKIYSQIIEKSKSFDIVHIQHQFGFFLERKNYIQTLIDFFNLLRNIKSKKVFVTFHTEPLFYKDKSKKKRSKLKKIFYKLKEKYLWKKLLRICKQMMQKEKIKYNFISHNQLIKNSLLSLGFHNENIHHLFLPVKMIKNKEEASCFYDNLKKFKNENSILIGIIGFLEEHKGILELIEALKVLPRNYKLVLCGGQRLSYDSSFLERIRAKIHNTKLLKNRVFITGFVNEAHFHYCFEMIDIFVYPYHGFFASSSAAIGFACQARKPIITSKVKCFEEISNVYKCFELVNCHTVYELANMIQKVAEDENRSNELVNNVQKFLTENQWETAGQKFMNYYQSI